MNKQKGFTLVEMLIVVTILAVLVATVVAAINPAKVIAEARNARRWGDVNATMTGIYRYVIENSSNIKQISTQEMQLGSATDGCNNNCPNALKECLDLSSTLKGFLPIIPTDPLVGTSERTGYSVKRDEFNVVTVNACKAENGLVIKMAR